MLGDLIQSQAEPYVKVSFVPGLSRVCDRFETQKYGRRNHEPTAQSFNPKLCRAFEPRRDPACAAAIGTKKRTILREIGGGQDQELRLERCLC